MQSYPPTLIIRHKKENLRKCSLRGLENRADLRFLTYPFQNLPPLTGYVMLVMEGAPELSIEDAGRGILLLDSTWHYLPKMVSAVEKTASCEKRVLPSLYRTAYPRCQADCVDPERGLSSIEALYLVHQILHRSTEGLLDHYYWKKQFLQINNL